MLTQAEADALLQAAKVLVNCPHINFPQPGESETLEIETTTGRETLTIDVINRRGKIVISKCTYQTRYRRTDILLRVDLAGAPHTNPDGTEVPCPHIHIYREGYGDKWAYPIQDIMPTTLSDFGQVLYDYLRYNNIINIPQIQVQGGGLV